LANSGGPVEISQRDADWTALLYGFKDQ